MEKDIVSRNWKLQKLKRCADISMPDKDINDLSEREYELVNSNFAIGAINEMNKMQGDHAPVKSENTETTHVSVEEIRDMLDKKQKDY